jgi:hypothetical protein
VSDQSQGPGWWLASDGKWYPPEAAAGATPTQPQIPADPASTPTTVQPAATPPPTTPPAGPPTQPGPPVQGAPTDPQGQWGYPSGPPTGAPGAPGAPGAAPGGPPGGYPPQGYPGATTPGGPPPTSGGGQTGLINAIVNQVLVVVGGGLAFALTRGNGTDTAATTTSTASTSTTIDEDSTTTEKPDRSTTTEKPDRTTTTRRSPSSSRLTTTTTGVPETLATIPDVPADPSIYRQIFIDAMLDQGLTQAQAECAIDAVDAQIGLDTLVAQGGEVTPEQQVILDEIELACT